MPDLAAAVCSDQVERRGVEVLRILERQEVSLHRIVNGNRIRLEREDDLELDPGAWHSLRIEHARDSVRLSLGGIGIFRSRDGGLAAAGQVGLWSGGAATTAFDDLRIEALEEEGFAVDLADQGEVGLFKLTHTAYDAFQQRRRR